MFQAKIVLDSVSPANIRLTTFELQYPLIVHNEFLTHRAIGRSDDVEYNEWLEFSRNASSNRAIPSSKLINLVRDDPYVPADFRKSTKGMIAGSSLDEAAQTCARFVWLKMLDKQIEGVQDLEKIGVHKQWRNRPLGPWQWITVVATANGQMWEHFFKLRDHVAAQPDIATVARMAHELYSESTPEPLDYGGWHLPYIVSKDIVTILDSTMKLDVSMGILKKLSVARCARTSYLRQGEIVDARQDIQLYEDLLSADPVHASPFEHIAQASDEHMKSGNFIGYIQLRKALRLG